jgi:cysteine-rich repeat protein
VVDPGEQCDDGNTVGGDCCSALCLHEPNGSPCDDGDACTTGSACTAGLCGGGVAHTCPLCEACDGAGGCVVQPQTGCRETANEDDAALHIRNWSDDDHDRIVWKWLHGGATTVAEYGDPFSMDAYALCVFDISGATPNRLLSATVPPGGVCGKHPCWVTVGTNRVKYRSATTTPDGITKIVLDGGEEGKARIIVKGKGPLLGPPALPLSLPVRVQLQAENGGCWEATYLPEGIHKNTSEDFWGEGGP